MGAAPERGGCHLAGWRQSISVFSHFGIVVPLSQFVPWLFDHGLDVSRFVDDLFANCISAYFVLDVLIAVPVLWVAIATDRHLTSSQRRLAIAGSCLGASVGLPLYLYLRERDET